MNIVWVVLVVVLLYNVVYTHDQTLTGNYYVLDQIVAVKLFWWKQYIWHNGAGFCKARVRAKTLFLQMQERPLPIMLAPQAWNRTSRNMKVRVKIHKNDWTGARRSKLKSMSDLTCQEIHTPPRAMPHLIRSIPRHGEAPWEIQDYTSKAHLMSTIRT